MTTTLALVPFASVLFGALITYLLNVRGRRRDNENGVYQGAISAVALAMASTNYIGQLSWGGSTYEEREDIAKQSGIQYAQRFLHAAAEARAAIAVASTYDQTLAECYRGDPAAMFKAGDYQFGDDLIARLRKNLR